jgi:hypothetical protein
MAKVTKDTVKAILESSEDPMGPTQIGMALGVSYATASGAVTKLLKALVAEGWAYRTDERHSKYGKERNPSLFALDE